MKIIIFSVVTFTIDFVFFSRGKRLSITLGDYVCDKQNIGVKKIGLLLYHIFIGRLERAV